MARPIVHDGALASRPALRWRALALAAWALAWLTLFLSLPLLLVMAAAFLGKDEYGQPEWSWTMDNIRRVAGWGVFGWSADNWWTIGRSLTLSAVTTAVCVALAFPLAFHIAGLRPHWRYALLCLLMIPFCTNVVIRVYGWQLILAGASPPAQLMAWLGAIEPGEGLHPGSFAVYLGMVSTMCPFAALPLYASVERLDWSLVEAARDLYASRWRVFLHAVLPQVMPGLGVAAVLTFVPSLGMFVVSDLLGGAKHQLIGNLIQAQIGRDWPYGAALSLGLIALTIAGLALARWRKVEA